MDEAIEDLLKK
ncbi:MAG: hypothetical protein MSK39_07980 [Dysosmobacter sp.]|nr:hypothetical protein [Dysosmobacter sp.]